MTNNGSVGYAYYQDSPFTCSHDVNPLYRIDAEFNQFNPEYINILLSMLESEEFESGIVNSSEQYFTKIF